MMTKTATTSFGTTAREGHDSSRFYAQFDPPATTTVAGVGDLMAGRRIDAGARVGDARTMEGIPNGTAGLVFFSPPYMAAKGYEDGGDVDHIIDPPATFADYLDLIEAVTVRSAEILEPGGRYVVNVANIGRRPYRHLAALVTAAAERNGFLAEGEIVWRKAAGASSSVAWGSWRSPAAPVLRDTTERILVFSKAQHGRAGTPAERAALGFPHQSTIGGDEFMAATLDVWDIPPESATRVGHPAPFPVALARRVIELYTFVGDLVVDPFVGSGTTLVAAAETGRVGVGFDTAPAYVELANKRLADAAPRTPADPETFGRRARAWLTANGWEVLAQRSTLAGWSYNYRVRHPEHGDRHVVIAGGDRATGGLDAAEAATIVARAVLAADRGRRVLALTPDLEPGRAAASVLASASSLFDHHRVGTMTPTPDRAVS